MSGAAGPRTRGIDRSGGSGNGDDVESQDAGEEDSLMRNEDEVLGVDSGFDLFRAYECIDLVRIQAGRRGVRQIEVQTQNLREGSGHDGLSCLVDQNTMTCRQIRACLGSFWIGSCLEKISCTDSG